MKRWIFIFTLFFLTKISLATDWFPVGATTNYGVRFCCGPETDNYEILVTKDTVIDSKTMKIIETESNDFLVKRSFFYCEPDKVFEYVDGKYLPKYDFTKQVGDSFYVVLDSGKYSCDTLINYVDSIVPYDKEPILMVQYCKIRPNYNCTEYYKDRITSIKYIEKIWNPEIDNVWNVFGLEPPFYFLLCYKDSLLNLDNLYGLPCDYRVTSIMEKTNTNLPIKIFPNPATNKIQIEFTDSKKYQLIKIQLVDVQGKILQSIENIKLPFLELNVADYSNGMYYLNIIADDEFVTKPIIIQH